MTLNSPRQIYQQGTRGFLPNVNICCCFSWYPVSYGNYQTKKFKKVCNFGQRASVRILIYRTWVINWRTSSENVISLYWLSYISFGASLENLKIHQDTPCWWFLLFSLPCCLTMYRDYEEKKRFDYRNVSSWICTCLNVPTWRLSTRKKIFSTVDAITRHLRRKSDNILQKGDLAGS